MTDTAFEVQRHQIDLECSLVFILAKHFSKCQRSFNAEIQKAATITINALTIQSNHTQNKNIAEPTTGAAENLDIRGL